MLRTMLSRSLVARRSNFACSRWNHTTSKDALYYNRATAEGWGRDGLVSSVGDTPLDLRFKRPRTIGGKGEGQTPEQLLAMGYSSSFLSALQSAASNLCRMDVVKDVKVHTTVYLRPVEDRAVSGFALSAEVTVEGVDDDEVILQAHELDPFSRALQDGVKVDIRKMPRTEEPEQQETVLET